jgi:zinc-binding in reverse transcriptase
MILDGDETPQAFLLYTLYIIGGYSDNFEYLPIWNTKISLKIKNFLWLVRRNKILTKINLQKRGWMGSIQWVFCDGIKSSDHLFVACSFVNSICNGLPDTTISFSQGFLCKIYVVWIVQSL